METKVCARCKEDLPVEHFPLRRKPGTDHWYRFSYCGECRRGYARDRNARPEVSGKRRTEEHARYWNDPERFREDARRRRRQAGIPERRSTSNSKMLDKYGITREEYFALKEAQHGCCAICGREPKTRRLAVDHDHATGKVRGLLCAACNMGLGAYRDDIAMLRRAIAYLEAQ